MKTISENTISDAVRELCIEAATKLDEDVKAAIKNAAETEESPLGRDVLKQIVDNYELAEEKGAPMCQDTGI
ncbi:MAG: fumarate hydratase, partial [Deltaproteobacteria bacterium]|nr:fumarate hydratase [Deltaproteobacteria bacterium]